MAASKARELPLSLKTYSLCHSNSMRLVSVTSI